MTGADLERHIFHLSAVASQSPSTWERDFARSIIKTSRRRGWKPTKKQAGIMRRLVFDLFHLSEEGELQVIE